MKNRKEVIEILNCNPVMVGRFVNQGRLTLDPHKGVDRRKKYYTDESVEKLRISREGKSSGKLEKIKKIYKKKSIKKIGKKIESFELNEIGKSVMAETIDEMKSLGIYRKNDNYAIFDYAMFYQISMATTEMAAENIIDGMHERINHDIKISLMINKLLDAKRKSLGLDPAAREKLTISEKKAMDEMGDLING